MPTTDPYYTPASGTSSRGTYTPPAGTTVAPAGTAGVVVRDANGKVTGVKYVDGTGRTVKTYVYDGGSLVATGNEGDAPPKQKFDLKLVLQEYGIYALAASVLLFKLKR